MVDNREFCRQDNSIGIKYLSTKLTEKAILVIISYGYGYGPTWISLSWWRHQMETFSALLVICAGNSPVNGEFPAQRPVTRSVDILFDVRLNKRLGKQWWGGWFETLSHPLWRHRSDNACKDVINVTWAHWSIEIWSCIYALVSYIIISSRNGMLPIWCQDINWPTTDILSPGYFRANVSEAQFEILFDE